MIDAIHALLESRVLTDRQISCLIIASPCLAMVAAWFVGLAALSFCGIEKE